MKKLKKLREGLEMVCNRFLPVIAWMFLIIFIPVVTVVLMSIATTLGRIERNFSAVQDIRADVDHLNKITSCLEPARDPDPEQQQELPELPVGE